MVRNALHAYIDAKRRHDVDRIVELRTEDCFDESLPLGTRVEGREAVRAFFTAFFAAVPDYWAKFDGEAFGDDTAVVWGRFGGTFNGRPVSVPVTFVCTFRDGKVVGDRYYFDGQTLAAQAGLSLDELRGAVPA